MLFLKINWPKSTDQKYSGSLMRPWLSLLRTLCTKSFWKRWTYRIMTKTVIVTEPPEVAVPSPWRNYIARMTNLGGGTAISGGGTPNTGAWTLFRTVPAEFNHWMWAHHTSSSRRPSLAAGASEDTVQCYTDFWLRPRHRVCLLQQYCLHSHWQFRPSWSQLGRARRSVRSMNQNN